MCQGENRTGNVSMYGLELSPKAKSLLPDVAIIMIIAYGDAQTK
jgi:hypothetical protein